VGFVVAGLQWLLFSFELDDTISRFFEHDIAVEAILALALGNVAAGMVYWFVVTAGVAAMARIDRQQRRSAGGGYRDVLSQLGKVVLPRIKAVAVVVFLALTVIGIPWAIRNGYRWAFIEEAVLLDGASAGSAASASVRAVDGRWWYVTSCLFLLGMLGVILGPAVAFILMFWSSFGVSFINLVSSLIFAAVAPYVAIARVLLYFHATTAARSPG
jgi:hypothetical protein